MSKLTAQLRKIGNRVGLTHRLKDAQVGLEGAERIEELEQIVMHLQIELGKDSIRMAHMRHQMNQQEYKQ